MPTRPIRSAARGLVWALLCSAAVGCTASGSDVQLQRDAFSFPTGLKVARAPIRPAGQPDAPDNYVLFVVNANSELRSDSGSIDVVDLGRVQDVIKGWLDHLKNPQGMDCASYAGGLPETHKAIDDGGSGLSCTCDVSNATTLQCEEAYFIRRSASVRVGNFATDLSVQDFTADGATRLRVFAPTRGDPSVTWADFDGNNLQCSSGPEAYPLCDDAHRLTSLDNDPNLAVLPNEPFAVFADVVRAVDPAGNPVAPTHGFAMVTHLSSGAVSLIDAPAPGTGDVRITDILGGVFGDPSQAAHGATSVAGLPVQPVPPPASPAPGEGVPEVVPEVLYVASDTDHRVQLFNVGMRAGAAAYLVPSTFFILNAVGSTSGQGSVNSRGIRFSSDGKRLYLVNRTPPSIQIYDTTPGADGAPSNALLGASDLCRQASTAAVAGVGTDERVYITCFQEGQIYAVNPFGQSQVEDIITVGRGPYAADVLSTLNPSPMPPTPKYLFVTNVLEDTIAVIDVDPSSSTRHRVVLRIGTPRAP